MKKVILTLLMFTLGVTSFAQEKGKKNQMSLEQKAKKQVANIDKQIDLTSEQESKVYELNLASLQKMKEIKSQGSLTQDEAKAKIKVVQKDKKKRMMEILTTEQKEKLKSKRKN